MIPPNIGELSMKLSQENVTENLNALREFMRKNSLGACYISSSDAYLNEYVPMSNCHRYYFTLFSGSTAELLVPLEGKARLYVDGRYHEQADNEVNLDEVEVVKVGQNRSLFKTLVEDLPKITGESIGIEGERTPLFYYNKMAEKKKISSFVNGEIANLLSKNTKTSLNTVKELPVSMMGKSTADKLDEIVESESEAYFITALDSIAWLANSRGYHLPNLSSFFARALVTKTKLYLFLDPEVKTEISSKEIEVINIDYTGLEAKLSKLGESCKLSKVFYDQGMLSFADYSMLEKVFGKAQIENKDGGIEWFQSIKNEGELNSIRDSFKRADQAIYNTICWVKKSLKSNEKISERDLYNKTTECYQAEGAVEQSFGTIAGVGPNGSIIHYGDPKESVFIKEDDMVLLDSGGYFDSGFATDTTRTFMAAEEEGSPKHKEIYTLVLKGTLGCQNAVFKEGTLGSAIDMLARKPLYEAGYDFAHGTGHGVGVHVHEGGVRISPQSTLPMKKGQVVSIEPGIYIPGFGGVRIENIATVIEHPTLEGFLTFECLVYIGFDPLLIDYKLLTDQEKKWLDDYENICRTRGTSFL